MKTPKDIIEEDLGSAPDDWRSNPDYKVDLNTAENWMERYAEQFDPSISFGEFDYGDSVRDVIEFVWDIVGANADHSEGNTSDDITLRYKTTIEIKIFTNK